DFEGDLAAFGDERLLGRQVVKAVSARIRRSANTAGLQAAFRGRSKGTGRQHAEVDAGVLRRMLFRSLLRCHDERDEEKCRGPSKRKPFVHQDLRWRGEITQSPGDRNAAPWTALRILAELWA